MISTIAYPLLNNTKNPTMILDLEGTDFIDNSTNPIFVPSEAECLGSALVLANTPQIPSPQIVQDILTGAQSWFPLTGAFGGRTPPFFPLTPLTTQPMWMGLVYEGMMIELEPTNGFSAENIRCLLNENFQGLPQALPRNYPPLSIPQTLALNTSWFCLEGDAPSLDTNTWNFDRAILDLLRSYPNHLASEIGGNLFTLFHLWGSETNKNIRLFWNHNLLERRDFYPYATTSMAASITIFLTLLASRQQTL